MFGRIKDILESESFAVSDIVRQWNYIDHITAENDGIQNYQLFNDARSDFYAAADWSNGYPAATGSGSEAPVVEPVETTRLPKRRVSRNTDFIGR